MIVNYGALLMPREKFLEALKKQGEKVEKPEQAEQKQKLPYLLQPKRK
jgi:hypothetical protein